MSEQKLGVTLNELAFLAAAIHLATAVLEGNEEKIDDGVTMLRFGWDHGVFGGKHVLNMSTKVLAASETAKAERQPETTRPLLS